MTAKESIKHAFRELLKEHPLNRITVIQVCEAAAVNRQTFYYYFTDIIDLLKSVLFEEIMDEINKGRAYETWKHGFLTTTHFLKSNAKSFINLYDSTYWNEVNQFLTECSNKLLSGVIDECVRRTGRNINEKDRDFMIRYYRIAFNGIMTEWVRDGMQEEPEDLLRQISVLVDGSILRALSKFSQNLDTRP